MTAEELAYVAGFFDGEGYVSVVRPKGPNGTRYRRLTARITQVDCGVLDWIADEFGGRVHPKYDDRVVARGWQPCFEAQFTYRRAEGLLRAILPYLRLKRQAVADALEIAYPQG